MKDFIKAFLIAFVFVFAYAGCGAPVGVTPEKSETVDFGSMNTHYEWTPFTKDGHRYILVKRSLDKVFSVLHHPDCSCLKKITAEKGI